MQERQLLLPFYDPLEVAALERVRLFREIRAQNSTFEKRVDGFMRDVEGLFREIIGRLDELELTIGSGQDDADWWKRGQSDTDSQ